jgi:phosphoglycerate dehydrogenase-like enzyme
MADAPWRILALVPLGEDLVRPMFADLDVEVGFPETRDRDGMQAALAEAELVIGDFTGTLRLDAAAVGAAPSLAFVQMPQVGVDSCDLPALSAAGVPVANTAGANARAVAEWALGAALTLCRRLAWGDRRMRSGEWPQSELLARGTREIHTLRVGILGFGAIGSEVARLFAALGCDVSYWSRRRRPDAAATYRRELDDLLSSSDILPEDAVLQALDHGRLGGAALDVFEPEPPATGHALRSHENVLLSPHVAGATAQAQLNIVTLVMSNIRAAIEGAPVVNVVNGLDPVIRRR